jgi:hypothetical protein
MSSLQGPFNAPLMMSISHSRVSAIHWRKDYAPSLFPRTTMSMGNLPCTNVSIKVTDLHTKRHVLRIHSLLRSNTGSMWPS